MKKIILFLIINYTLCIMHCVAQYPEHAIGLHGGTSWPFVLFNPSIAQTSLPLSYHGGIQYRMVSEKYFGIKIELNYSQQGFKDTEGHRQLNYIELPFMTHLTFGQKLFRFFIDLGPEIAYLIQEKTIISHTHQHITPIKNKFDYGLVGGIGCEFNTTYGIYTIDARYKFGLNNIFGNSASEQFKSSTTQNITLSLAYLFPIREKK